MKKKEIEGKVQTLTHIVYILEKRVNGMRELMNELYKYIFDNVPDAIYKLEPKFPGDWRPFKYVGRDSI